MKLSNYIVKVECSNEVLLFSTISKTVISVTKKYYQDLLLGSKCNKFDIVKSKELDYLKKKFFLIEDNVEEKNIVRYIFNKDRLDQKILSTYIVFSSICNFKCVYCYEEGQTNRQHIINNETINNILKWYEKKFLNKRYEECKIILFGGEPLIHIDLFSKFLQSLKVITQKFNILLTTSIITNGYLLTNDVLTILKKYNLNEIQITLDGVGDVHNKRRPLRNGGKTFDVIINNIKSLEKFDGQFLFRLSFDNNNVSQIKELILYLSKLKIKNKFQIYLAPIHQTTLQKNEYCSFCSKNVAENFQIIQAYKDLYSYMNKLGLSIPNFFTNGPCMSISDDTVLIDNYGDLYKCVELIGIPEMKIGNVKDAYISQNFYNFVGNTNIEKCINKGCIFPLLCGGGCRMQSYLKTGNWQDCDCKSDYFITLIPFFLEEKYGKKHK